MASALLLVVLLPALGALINGLRASNKPLIHKNRNVTNIIAVGATALSAIIATVGVVIPYISHGIASPLEFSYYTWIPSGFGQVGNHLADFKADFAFRVDPLSCTMLMVVTWIGFLIHVYATGYMGQEEHGYTRFFAYLNLFMFMMLLLVLGANYVVMFVGWEGVGLCSYLLIGFYYDKNFAADAGKKAFIINRIGDFGFILGIFLIFNTFGTADYSKVFALASAHGEQCAGAATAICLLLFVGACGKSAQVPLYVWLPDAMAGPTPVSALIHAATMVTAGVFLVARTHALFEASATAQTVVVLVGALTALLAALIAIGQDDLKKILAYSTVSQLGYMFIGVGLGPIGYVPGMFHLITHAFFKAQLFLGAGSVMHGNDDDTDVKHFGGLRAAMPVTFWTTVAAWAAIIGVPLTAGFYSKDQILGAAFDHGGIGMFAWVVGVLTAGLTAFYMSRLLFLTFAGQRRWPDGRHPHESPGVMTLPLAVLGLLALVAGFLLSTFTGEGGRLQDFLGPVLGTPDEYPSLASALWLSAVATGVAALGAGVAWLLYGQGGTDWLALRVRFAPAWRTLAERLYVDQVYEFFTVTLGRALAAFLAVTVDQRVLDGAVNGT